VTYKDLIDTLVRDSGDEGAAYRTNAYRWLNLVRQEAMMRGSWSSGKDSVATFDTDPLVTNGIYALVGYASVMGDEMYDQTNDCVIRRDTENTLKAFDANANENGPPTLWADSGMNSAGETQIRLWPIPAEVLKIAFLGQKSLTDITSAQESVSIDPYFGALSSIGAMLQFGLRYYHDLNNNEDYVQVRGSKAAFYDAIKLYSAGTTADSVKSSRLEPVGRRPNVRPYGRLDPSHFNNR
jgi:hypothetical protein